MVAIQRTFQYNGFMSDKKRPSISRRNWRNRGGCERKARSNGECAISSAQSRVDVVALMSTWIAREIAPYEQRLGIKLRYAIETLHDGKSRFIVKDVADTEA